MRLAGSALTFLVFLESTVASPHHPKKGSDSLVAREPVYELPPFLWIRPCLCGEDQTYPQRIGGPRKVYKQVRGRDDEVKQSEVSPDPEPQSSAFHGACCFLGQTRATGTDHRFGEKGMHHRGL